ncbi:phage tail tip lysozyme [Rhodopila sp.]|uniref:phage tail tip lysozyme n=1 Tax=Rhodopila sp. TaxID=2480087 RepID=UPI003D0BAD73
MSGSNPQIAIKITADQAAASKQIQAFNKTLGGLDKRSQALTKTTSKMTDTVGINNLSKSMRGLARESLGAFENIGRIITPLAVITSAASVAGLAKLVSGWEDYGTSLLMTSRRAGVSVEKLSALQGAAKLAGASAEGMSSSLVSLQDNLTGLSTGRADPKFIAAFSQLHISARNAGEAMPKILMALSKIPNMSVRAAWATSLLGSSAAELAPIWTRSATEIRKYVADGAKYNTTTTEQAKAADALREKQEELTIASTKLGNTIAGALAPVLTPLITELTTWTMKNQDLIASDATKWFNDYSHAISAIKTTLEPVVKLFGGWQDVMEVIAPFIVARMVPGVGALEDAIVGLGVKTAFTLTKLTALAALETATGGVVGAGAGATLGAGIVAGAVGGLAVAGAAGSYVAGRDSFTRTSQAGKEGFTIASSVDDAGNPTAYANPKTGETKPASDFDTKAAGAVSANYVMARLMKDGLSKAAAAGEAAQMNAESSMNPTEQGDKDASGKYTAYGLLQLHPDRQAYFKKLFGHDIRQSTADEQIDFDAIELRTTEKKTGNLLSRDKSPYAAGYDATGGERPYDPLGLKAIARGMAARDIYNAYKEPPAPPPLPAIQNGTGTATTQPTAPPLNGKASLHVTLGGNVPPGTTTKGSVAGNVFDGPPKVTQTTLAGP